MGRHRLILVLFIAVVRLASSFADEHVTVDKQVNAAVAKSLPYIARRGQWWIDSKDCVSCHRTAFTIWAHASAADAGLTVDTQQLNEWVNWSFDSLLKKNDKDAVVATTNLDGVAQMLHVTSKLELSPERQNDRAKLLKFLIDGQQDSGAWKPAGQLPAQKRPEMETQYVTTSWNHWLAAGSGLKENASTNAKLFLSKEVDPTSTEMLVVNLLNAESAESKNSVLAQILAEQNEDGGFGWIRKGESDAMATGQVLFAAAMVEDHTEVLEQLNKATAFLLKTQKDDGSWKVKGTKKNRQTKFQETATYWGTCWAVIGMLEFRQSVER